ncbi:type IV pilin protein [Montanilutibacter psychrotolerans]|uniref:Type IV pilin protein n=1 Tax=Montanilutibacter psychrotolerans TaxID=1327343 RepID=A0A3M8T4N9_9GAMM|nr:type IV pilin protein [Lysobacter psychrotolerans]RNF86170.1 type IV pilin protein [Lysobacter psychrotolerans]
MTVSVANKRSRTSHHGGRASRGFSLLELMIVVVVIAILAGIAMTRYEDSMVRSRRATASACMLEAAQFMERFYTTNLRYHQTVTGVAVALPALTCANDLRGHYTIALNAVAAQTYTIRATPQGRQAAKDTKCGNLSMNQAGTKSASGTAGDCFK